MKAYDVSKLADSTDARERGLRFLSYILDEIMGQPGMVSISYAVHERTTVYKVDCAANVLGRLIGTKGRTISSIRTLLMTLLYPFGIRAIIEIPYYPLE